MSRPFARLSNLEREGARRIARNLLRDGMEPALVRRHMAEKRAVMMDMHEISALKPAAYAASLPPPCEGKDCAPGAAPAFAFRSGRWERAEVSQLRALLKAGKALREISATLNRSADSVQGKMRDLNLSFGRPRRGFSEAEITAICEGRASGERFASIAARINRSESAIRQKYSSLITKGAV